MTATFADWNDADTARVRRDVLNNYRAQRKYNTPAEAASELRNAYARNLAEHAVEHDEVDPYWRAGFAVAAACYDRVWERIDADEEPNYWVMGRIGWSS